MKSKRQTVKKAKTGGRREAASRQDTSNKRRQAAKEAKVKDGRAGSSLHLAPVSYSGKPPMGLGPTAACSRAWQFKAARRQTNTSET